MSSRHSTVIWMLVSIHQKTKSGHHILKYSHGMRDMCDLLVFGARGQCKTNELMLTFRTRDTICGEQKINRPTSALTLILPEKLHHDIVRLSFLLDVLDFNVLLGRQLGFPLAASQRLRLPFQHWVKGGRSNSPQVSATHQPSSTQPDASVCPSAF